MNAIATESIERMQLQCPLTEEISNVKVIRTGMSTKQNHNSKSTQKMLIANHSKHRIHRTNDTILNERKQYP